MSLVRIHTKSPVETVRKKGKKRRRHRLIEEDTVFLIDSRVVRDVMVRCFFLELEGICDMDE